MPMVTMKALLETGVHFGHQSRKWNPKMDEFIFTKRNGIHIIDLTQTLSNCKLVYETVRSTVARGGTILYCGTKRQAQETIESEANRAGMPYVNQRWLGGTLTNWRTIRSRLQQLERMERQRNEGDIEMLTKKERLMLERKIERLNYKIGGLRTMKQLPDMLFVIDTRREYTAIREANILGIPVIALVDTNSDPDPIDYIIPANDDAIRAIKLLTGMVTDAVLEGYAMRKAYGADDGGDEDIDFESYMTEASDEDYLGRSTLAKIRDNGIAFDGDSDEDDFDDFDE